MGWGGCELSFSERDLRGWMVMVVVMHGCHVVRTGEREGQMSSSGLGGVEVK